MRGITRESLCSRLQGMEEEELEEIVHHLNNNCEDRVKPELMAWYKDWEDFRQDWKGIGFIEEDIKGILDYGISTGEFYVREDGQIFRFSM